LLQQRSFSNSTSCASTQEQFVARVKDVTWRLPKGELIVGGYWRAYDEWAAGSAGDQRREPFAPDMNLVNALTSDYPMFIRKFDDSRFAGQPGGISSAQTRPQQPASTDVEFLKDQQGHLTVTRTAKA
jgi:hypothetical protein